jgi:hypothetical protein
LPSDSTARNDLTELVGNAVKVIVDDDLAHYVRWNFKQLLNELQPEDIQPDEYMALNVILAKAISRKLALTGPGDTLRVPLVVPETELRRPPLRVVTHNTTANLA